MSSNSIAIAEFKDACNLLNSYKIFKFSCPETSLCNVTNFNLVTLNSDVEDVLGHVSFAEDGAEGLLVGATLGKNNLTFEFRYGTTGLISPDSFVTGLEHFAIVLNILAHKSSVLPLFPIRNFLGVSTSRTPNSPSFIAYNELGRPYTGIHSGKSTFSDLWKSTPMKTLDLTSALRVAEDVYTVFRQFHVPKIPVELVTEEWNKRFGTSTGIIFPISDSWDRFLRTNKKFSLARQIDGYHLETNGHSVGPEDFDGLKVLLAEFPKLEADISKRMELNDTPENSIEFGVDLG